METIEIPACRAGLPAEPYYIHLLVNVGGNKLGVQFFDLEQVPGPYFYRWLNDRAALCNLHTRFIERVGWYESAHDRWSAIMTLAGIARMWGKDVRLIRDAIYTASQVQAILGKTQKLPAIRKGELCRTGC